MDQLATLEQLLTEGREKFKTRGVGELARLALVISELEGKARQPAAELMQVSDLTGQGAGRLRVCPSLHRTLGESLSYGASVFLPENCTSCETWR